MRGLAHFRLRDSGTQVTAGVREHSLAVTVDFYNVYTFDRSGRLLGYFDHGTYYRRGLDHTLIEKTRGDDGGWEVRRLGEDEANTRYEEIFEPLRRIGTQVTKNRVVWTDTEDIPVRRRQAMAVFAQIGAMQPEALARDAAAFRQVYTPVAILPPDQYLSLVVQVTEGCSYNQCRFCHFYRDQSFRVKPQRELADHLDAIVRFFGPGISVRRSVFLADANALVGDPDRLVPLLRLISERCFGDNGMPAFKPNGIYSFVDSFHTRFDEAETWRTYARHGVRRVYLGVESGCDDLLAAIDKPTDSEAVLNAVTVLKSSGIDVGLIFITGLGGAAFAERHVTESGELLARLPLDGRDFVYFSPYVPTGPPEAMAEFDPPLSRDECLEQQQRLETYLEGHSARPRRATYGLEEFVY